MPDTYKRLLQIFTRKPDCPQHRARRGAIIALGQAGALTFEW
jgi:hypothetical protein